ncbi:hypothetical protein SAMD00019534_041430 [Acytostelium subglobosum LB1]|uniref:hypothetical protein n=1 Tax=Acytostelium subglobosum LB1 TaxID=1410327 RepID=UPI000644E639|nr:hypothetical protein SAMD00019534_041430 [Acytostelium subglobosum LB1]GAM20968.1 hypothetical protein SAMD00019534_041430 [Acytostelium subglobosum LB1]|eukprot:XP_012756102.1 hypothetical protein SAMD00019534_041430 [Acytostelium subglobosum LB1]
MDTLPPQLIANILYLDLSNQFKCGRDGPKAQVCVGPASFTITANNTPGGVQQQPNPSTMTMTTKDVICFDKNDSAYRSLIRYSLVCRGWKDAVVGLIPIHSFSITNASGLKLLLSFINRINRLPQMTTLNFVVSEQLRSLTPATSEPYSRYWTPSVNSTPTMITNPTSSMLAYNNCSMNHVFSTYPSLLAAHVDGDTRTGNGTDTAGSDSVNGNGKEANPNPGKKIKSFFKSLLPNDEHELRREHFERLLKSGLAVQSLRFTHDSWESHYGACLSLSLLAWPLAELNLSGNKLNDGTMKLILLAFSSLKVIHLHSLNLSHNNLSNESVLGLAKLIKSYGVPSRINLSHNQVTSAPIKPLLEAMRSGIEPFSIQLSHNKLNDLGGVLFCRYLQTNSNLRELNLANNNLTCETLILMAEALRTNASLTSLKMSLVVMGHEETLALDTALRENTTLRQFAMAACVATSLAGSKLAQAVARSRSITRLDLRYNSIDITGAKTLIESLAVNELLVYLDLGYCGIGAEAGALFGPSLSANKHLQSLYLNDNRLGASGIIAISEGLAANSTLRDLDLSSNCSINETLGLEAVSRLSDAMARNTSLHSLRLNFNRLGHESVSLLAAALRSNRSLVSLSLAGNYIRNEGAIALKGALQVNTTLRSLNLNTAGLQADGLLTLLGALTTNTHLAEVNLANQAATPDELVQIDKALRQVLQRNSSLVQLEVLPSVSERRPYLYERQRHHYKFKKYLLKLYEWKSVAKERLIEQFSLLLKT